MTNHLEPARAVPIVAEADVMVCGGGPAGIAAAVAAARGGARVVLVESQGCLGGVWTTGLLSYIIDADRNHPFARELVQRLTALDGVPPQRDEHAPEERPQAPPGILYRAETMKCVIDQLCLESSVAVRLYTRVVAATRDEANRLALVLTESKSGREAWRAKVFVDATGDGDLAARAGCGFELGQPDTGRTQPMTLMGLLGGIDAAAVAPFLTGGQAGHYAGKEALLAELRRAGREPSYSKPTLFHVHGGLFALMANHEYGASGIDAAQLTEATMRARREIFGLVRGLRGLGGRWSGLELVATAAHIGVREGRRINGLYTVTRDDLVRGARHADAVCRVEFPVDVHATDPAVGKAYGDEGVRVRPYDIPLRALVARDVDRLLLAGRCISGDFLAHASYRVTGYAMQLGWGAGLAAAAWAATGVRPERVGDDAVGPARRIEEPAA